MKENKNSTLFFSNQSALPIVPSPNTYLLLLEHQGLGAGERERLGVLSRVLFFFFFVLPLQSMNQKNLDDVFDGPKHYCTSASVYGEAAIRHILALTASSGGRGGSVTQHETTRELYKPVSSIPLFSQL